MGDRSNCLEKLAGRYQPEQTDVGCNAMAGTTGVRVDGQKRGRVGRRKFRNVELIPGLPNDIVLQNIVPKMPWRSFALAAVNRLWQAAVGSRLVYKARVNSHSTETLVVILFEDIGEIFLYNMRDRDFHPIPICPLDLRSWSSKFTTLDGKIYVLGGWDYHDETANSRNVYAFDLAGQSGWKMCAPMLEPRQRFGCAAFNGKIYVLGGDYRGRLVCGSEVYDPTIDAWTRIAPMPSPRVDLPVATLGDEIFVHGGQTFPEQGTYLPAEAYNPVKDEWTLV